MKKNEKIFIFTIIVLFFQICRNINLNIYIFILLTSYLFLYFFSIKVKMNKLSLTEKIFLISYIIIPINSIFYLKSNEYLIALGRYLVTFPFIMYCFLYLKLNKKLIYKIWEYFVYFNILTSFSVIYQIFFGEITFFAKSSFRSGVVRYASLAGSLTAFGTIGAFSLAIILFSNNEIFSEKKKIIYGIVIAFGMLLTLQKAAVANIIIVLILYIIFNLKKRKIYINLILFLILIFFIVFFFKDSILGKYIIKTLTYFKGNNSLDTKKDFLIRITELPINVIKENSIGLKNIVLGIGFKSLAGTLGLSKYPMAHNNYIDIILSGGMFSIFSFIALLLKIFFISFNQKIKILLIFSILITVNMFIGAASFYQPIMCVIIFVSISNLNNNKKIRE